jgi:CBS domain-containing protein
MTSTITTVGPEATVEEVAQTLLERRISAMPVVDTNGSVIGIISEGDLMRRAELGTERHRSWWLSIIGGPTEKAAAYIKSHGRSASDVMTKDVIVVDEDTGLEEIAALLEEHGIKRVPVVKTGQLVGIVSRANLLQGLVSARIVKTSGPNDETIRHTVRFVLQRGAGVRDKFIDIVVLDGVVHLWGSVASEVEKNAARLAAEGVSGVLEVHDHLQVVAWAPQLDLGAE